MTKFRPDPKPTKTPPKKKKKIPYKRKSMGELDLFISIWYERPHISQISGKYLPDFNVTLFSHILPKSIYPKFRLNKQNIVLKTTQEHQDWETKKYTLKNNPQWKWIFELEASLKNQYKLL